MPSRNLTVIALAILISLVCHRKATQRRYASLVAEAMDQVSNYYVRPIERRQLFEGAMRGMIRDLDPYSEYISPEDFERFQESLDQEFGGVGIEVLKDPETGLLTVFTPLLDTPAFHAGLRAGDRVLSIDGQATQDLSIDESVKLMRGLPGSTVTLELAHAGDETPEEVVIERAVIQVASVLGDARLPDGSWDFHLQADQRIGYIRMYKFGKQTVEEFDAALTQMEGRVQGIILDLRGNAGGLLDAAVSVCDRFLEDGVIVTTRGRDAEEILEEFRARANSDDVGPDVIVTVLINGFSASASEIVAACLQDYQRAVIVGQRSWGKGTVQNILPLESGQSAIRLTTATYWRPSGKNIHRLPGDAEDVDWGVFPSAGFDVELDDEQMAKVVRQRRERDVLRSPDAPATIEPAEATSVDLQLQRAVEYIQGQLKEAEEAELEPVAAGDAIVPGCFPLASPIRHLYVLIRNA